MSQQMWARLLFRETKERMSGLRGVFEDPNVRLQAPPIFTHDEASIQPDSIYRPLMSLVQVSEATLFDSTLHNQISLIQFQLILTRGYHLHSNSSWKKLPFPDHLLSQL